MCMRTNNYENGIPNRNPLVTGEWPRVPRKTVLCVNQRETSRSIELACLKIFGVSAGARWACPGASGPCGCKVGVSGSEGSVRAQGGRLRVRGVRAGARWACPGPDGL